jgi:hypothetical protein
MRRYGRRLEEGLSPVRAERSQVGQPRRRCPALVELALLGLRRLADLPLDRSLLQRASPFTALPIFTYATGQ